MLLIIDKPLKGKEIKLLDNYCSTYQICSDDTSSWLVDLPKVEIYIINITQTEIGSRSYAMRWFEVNLPDIVERKMDIIYYRQTQAIAKKNLDRMKCKIIKSFPIQARNKEDLLKKINHDGMPYVRSECSFCFSCCCNKISMGNCLKGIFGSARYC